MTNICGNQSSRRRTLEAIRADGLRTALLYGPSYVGKRSFITSALREAVEDPDFLLVDGSVSGAREAVAFSPSAPVFSAYRAIVVDGADRLSDAAQDAYLKLCEEPPPTCRIFLVAEDEGNMAPALLSRIEAVVKWSLLDGEEFAAFLEAQPVTEDADARSLSYGRPGLYLSMVGKPEFAALRADVSRHLEGAGSSIPFVPDVVGGLKSGASPERDAIALICRMCALSFVGRSAPSLVRKVLQFSALLSRVPSVNAEIHWKRAVLSAPV